MRVETEFDKMINHLYDDIHSSYLREHERDFIQALHNKVIYANRKPDPEEIRTLKTMYQLFIKRKLQA